MSEPIRILCVFSTLDRGGAESMCMNLYRHIDREIVQFDFVKHTQEKGAFEDEIAALGGKIYAAPRYSMYNHLVYTKWWRKFLSDHPEYQIVHGHFFTISAVFLKIAQQVGRTTIGHSHCTPSTRKSVKNTLSNALISQIEGVSDYCFACSQAAGEWIFRTKPFKVLNNAVDAQKFRYSPDTRKAVREEFGFSDELVLGTVGRIMHQKNPLGMVDIFKAVHDRNPKTRLLWVGNGDMRGAAEARVQELGLTDSVIFTGVRSDVDRLMQGMDVFILPSYYEGLPVVAIEAQAAGLACFISDGVTTECNVTESCRFISLNRPEAWADAILENQGTRKDVYQQIIDAGYDIHTTAKWLEDFYLKISEETDHADTDGLHAGI